MTLKFSVLPLIAAVLLATATSPDAKTVPAPKQAKEQLKRIPGTPTVTNLVTCGGAILGTATVVDDQDLGTLTVTFQTSTGWSLKETNVYAGTVEGIPVDCYGKPRTNLFPYRTTSFSSGNCSANCRRGHGCDDDDHDTDDHHDHSGSGVQTHTVTIPLSGLPTEEIIISVNAKLTKGNNNKIDKSVWGQGVVMGNNGCAMRFSHVLEVR